MELIELVTEPEHPVPELFDLLLRALGYLDTGRPTLRALLHFETELVRLLGIHGQPGSPPPLPSAARIIPSPPPAPRSSRIWLARIRLLDSSASMAASWRPGGADDAFHLVRVAVGVYCAGNGGIAQHPGDGDLGGGAAVALADLAETLGDGEVAEELRLLELGVARAPVVDGKAGRSCRGSWHPVRRPEAMA